MIPQVIKARRHDEVVAGTRRMVDQAVGIFECPKLERGELLRHATELLVRLSVEKIVDHHTCRAELPAGQGATGGGKLLLIDHGMRVVALTGFVGIAGLEGALILARVAIEERSQRGRDDPSKVEDAGPRVFEGGGHTDHFVRILGTQGWVKRRLRPHKPRKSAILAGAGDPYGNRTRVSAVKGPRPNR